MPDAHERALKALERRGRLRTLSARAGIDFSSNDYLGFAASAELAGAIATAAGEGVPAGAGGSRLLRGNHPEHELLEAEAAAFFGAESALYFGGGFAANYTLFSTLPQRGDLVIHDALIHASVHDGMRAGRAETASAAHNDADAFEDAIRRWREAGGTGRPWIAVESLYSMDGDMAPLESLAAVADRHEAMLVIDEAHATGVLGPGGRGLGAHLEGRANVITLHTCGKALGVMGALVLGPRIVREFIINRGRALIYATAPSPLMAAGVRAGLRLAGGPEGEERRRRLAALVQHAGRTLHQETGLPISGTQIQPVIVGVDGRATELAASLQGRGYDVRAVRPPTVPEGTARLRISLTLNASLEAASQMILELAREMERMAA